MNRAIVSQGCGRSFLPRPQLCGSASSARSMAGRSQRTPRMATAAGVRPKTLTSERPKVDDPSSGAPGCSHKLGELVFPWPSLPGESSFNVRAKERALTDESTMGSACSGLVRPKLECKPGELNPG